MRNIVLNCPRFIAIRFSAVFSLAVLASFTMGSDVVAQTYRPPNREAGETPSKLPVPRFASLKADKVNGRMGPGEDYPIKYVYTRQGLPVKVTAETDIWRRIQDPSGSVVWVHKNALSSKKTVITRKVNNRPIYMLSKPDLKSRVVAQVGENYIGELLDSDGFWRKVRFGDYTGWVGTDVIFGGY